MIKRRDKTIAVIWIAICIIVPTKFRVVFGRGESMLPTLPTKTVKLCIKQKEYQVNDIISFRVDGLEIVHRIIMKVNYSGITYYETQGDNNSDKDLLPITKEQIRCKVIK